MNDQEKEQAYNEVLAALKQRGYTIRQLAEDCDCAKPTIHRNLRNEVGRGRVKERLCELLEPQELKKLGWESQSLLDELKGILERLHRHFENLKQRVETLEGKKMKERKSK